MNKKQATQKFREFADRLNDLCCELDVELDHGNAEMRLITPAVYSHHYSISDIGLETWRANDKDRKNKIPYYGAMLY
jgi:hypothetical protein